MKRIFVFLMLVGICFGGYRGRYDYGLDENEVTDVIGLRSNTEYERPALPFPSTSIRCAFPISSRSAVTESDTADRYTMGTDASHFLLSSAGYQLLTKSTNTATSSARFTIPAGGLNFQSQRGIVHILLYVSAANSFTGTTNAEMVLRIRFAHDAGYANYWEITVAADKSGGSMDYFSSETGWVLLSFPFGSGVTGGSWDYTSDVLYFLFELSSNMTDDMAVGDYVTIDSVFVTDTLNPIGGRIALMLDDGRAALYDSGVHQLAADRGIRLIIPAYAGQLGKTDRNGAEIMSSNELAAFVRLGHQVIVHSDQGLKGLTEEQQYKIMLQEQNDLIEWARSKQVDIGDGYLYFVTNANSYDENTIAAAKRLFKMFFPVKATPGGTTPETIIGFGIPQDPYRIPRVAIGSAFTTTEMAAMFANAANDNSLLICYTHDISASGDYSVADFTTILDGIVSNNYKVMTCTELSALFNSPVPARVTAKTAAYSLLVSDSGKTFTNNGDTDALTFTLPPAIFGLSYTFADIEGDATEDIIVDPKTVSEAITAVSITSETFTIAGNYQSAFPTGYLFTVSGSTGNDGTWIVKYARYDGSNTVITVTGDVTNATADGTLGYSDLIILAGVALDPGDKVIGDNDEASDVPADIIRFDCYQNGTWTTTAISGTFDDNGA